MKKEVTMSLNFAQQHYNLKQEAEKYHAYQKDFGNFFSLLGKLIESPEGLKDLKLTISEETPTKIIVTYCHLILSFSIEWDKETKSHQLVFKNEEGLSILKSWSLNSTDSSGTIATHNDRYFSFCGHDRSGHNTENSLYDKQYQQHFIYDFVEAISKELQLETP